MLRQCARWWSRQSRASTALAVRSPSVVGRFLTAEFYSEHMTLEMRMNVLRTVHAMADELGAPPAAQLSAVDSIVTSVE